MRYFFPRRVPTDRHLKRVEKALSDKRYKYMRKSSHDGFPLIYCSGVIFEEVPLANKSPHATTKYLFYKMANKREVRRYGL